MDEVSVETLKMSEEKPITKSFLEQKIHEKAVEHWKDDVRRAFRNGEKTIRFSNGSLPRDCIKRWKQVSDDDAILKARDLYFEIQLLIDLYPGLEDQLKALEDHYGIGYGFEELKKEWDSRKDEME